MLTVGKHLPKKLLNMIELQKKDIPVLDFIVNELSKSGTYIFTLNDLQMPTPCIIYCWLLSYLRKSSQTLYLVIIY
jgi:hypothetical protein